MPEIEISLVKALPLANKNAIQIIGLSSEQDFLKVATSQLHDSTDFASIDFANLGAVSSESVLRFPLQQSTYGAVKLPAAATSDSYRDLGGSISRTCGNFAEIVSLLHFDNLNLLSAFIEGVMLGNYEFNKFKSNASSRKLVKLTVLTELDLQTEVIQTIGVSAKQVKQVRDLVNTPANQLFPADLAEWAKEAAKQNQLEVEIWDEKRLEKEHCGGILAVGKGSANPPRLIKLTHSPKGSNFKLALVGKGITFDTGGLSLKPAASMAGMKYDMTGAATVLNAVIAIAKLGLNIEVTAWACVAENMPSGTATRPNDVVVARNGKTIEVMNTDAEGRVVLADGLSLASESQPDLIVDVATLTGAATVALGNRIAGLMGDDEAVNAVENAASDAGEKVWHMPLPNELRAVLDSPIADIANAKLGHTAGGMLIGGLFLKEFIGKNASGNSIPWAHLDIAGPANNDKEPYGYVPKGGTGALMRTLVSLASNLATKNR